MPPEAHPGVPRELYYPAHAISWNPDRSQVNFVTPMLVYDQQTHEHKKARETLSLNFAEYGIAHPILRTGLVGLVQLGILHRPDDLKKLLDSYKMTDSKSETMADLLEQALAGNIGSYSEDKRNLWKTTEISTHPEKSFGLLGRIYSSFPEIKGYINKNDLHEDRTFISIVDNLIALPKSKQEVADTYLQTFLNVFIDNRTLFVAEVTAEFKKHPHGMNINNLVNKISPLIRANLNKLASAYNMVYSSNPVKDTFEYIDTILLDEVESAKGFLSQLQRAGSTPEEFCVGHRRTTRVEENTEEGNVQSVLIRRDDGTDVRPHVNGQTKGVNIGDKSAQTVRLRSGETITIHSPSACPFFLFSFHEDTVTPPTHAAPQTH